MRNDIIKIMAEVFQISESLINGNMKKFESEKWDSLGHISLIVAIEDFFKIHFKPEDIIKMNSIDEIEAIIKKYL